MQWFLLKRKAIRRAKEVKAKRIYFYSFDCREKYAYSFRPFVFGAKEPFLILKVR